MFLQAGFSEIVPAIYLLKLPYFYQDKASWHRAYTAMKAKYNHAFKKKGVLVLGWLDAGFAYLFSQK